MRGLRGEAGDRLAGAGRAGGGLSERTGGGGGSSRADFALEKNEGVWVKVCCLTHPSVRRLSAVSLALRSVDCMRGRIVSFEQGLGLGIMMKQQCRRWGGARTKRADLLEFPSVE